MKNLTSVPWMAYACLLMEALALIFVTLMLVCPAPFSHSNLAVIVIKPNSPSSLVNSTFAPISGNSSTLYVPPISSISTPTSSSSSSSSQPTTSTPQTSTNASTSSPPKDSTTASIHAISTPSSTANTSTVDSPAPAPTAAAKRDVNATSDTLGLDTTIHDDANFKVENGTINPPDSTVARVTQMERLNGSSSIVNASIITPPINSTTLLRIGPLGSCFRTSGNLQTCTSAKLNSQYDFSQLQQSSFITSGLPSGMSTYPIILVVIIAVLLLKVMQDIAVLFIPAHTLPSAISAPASGWHGMCNWLICVVCLMLAIGSGVQRNKMSVAVKSFNTANQTKTMESIPLLAQTGTSFGFIWISVLLLAASFLLNRIMIKKQAMLDRAKEQLLADPSKRYMEQPPLPMYSRTSYNDPAAAAAAAAATTTSSLHNAKRSSSGLRVIREYLLSSKVDSSRHTHNHHSGSEISLPTKVLDDYIRRHYHPSDYSSSEQLPKAASLGYLHDYRRYAKESPPFHAYQSSLDGESRSREEAAQYVEEVRHKMATPAPSYWTSTPDQPQQVDLQTRREKEREYMAELRRQRSTTN